MVFRIPFFLNKKKRIIDDINRYRALQGEKKKVLFCQFSACLSVYSFLDHCWTMLWVDVSHYMVHSTKQKAVEKKESVLMVHDIYIYIYIISLSLHSFSCKILSLLSLRVWKLDFNYHLFVSLYQLWLSFDVHVQKKLIKQQGTNCCKEMKRILGFSCFLVQIRSLSIRNIKTVLLLHKISQEHIITFCMYDSILFSTLKWGVGIVGCMYVPQVNLL
jgi:hypothetical protein